MKIILFCGFLGAGKTSLMLRCLPHLTNRYSSMAILENEVGEAGVDGAILKQQGLQVRELFGGCICCTFQSDMLEAIDQLRTEYAPELLLMEATGAAHPSNVLAPLESHLTNIEAITVLGVSDLPRFDMLSQMLPQLNGDIIQRAHAMALTKVENADPDMEAQCREIMETKHPGIDIYTIPREGEAAVTELCRRWL